MVLIAGKKRDNSICHPFVCTRSLSLSRNTYYISSVPFLTFGRRKYAFNSLLALLAVSSVSPYSLQLKPLPLILGWLTGCFKTAAEPEQSILLRISPYVSLIKLLLPWPLLLPTEVWFIYLKIWFVSFYYCVCEVTDIRFGEKELPFTSRLWWLRLGLQAWFWALVCPGAPTEIRLLAITASTALNNRHNSESIKLA